MATRTKTTSVDRAANWILNQSWSTLALLAAISVGASVAVGSFAPANIVTTSIVPVAVERQDYGQGATRLVATTMRSAAGSLKANFVYDGGWGEEGVSGPSGDPYSDAGYLDTLEVKVEAEPTAEATAEAAPTTNNPEPASPDVRCEADPFADGCGGVRVPERPAADPQIGMPSRCAQGLESCDNKPCCNPKEVCGGYGGLNICHEEGEGESDTPTRVTAPETSPSADPQEPSSPGIRCEADPTADGCGNFKIPERPTTDSQTGMPERSPSPGSENPDEGESSLAGSCPDGGVPDSFTGECPNGELATYGVASTDTATDRTDGDSFGVAVPSVAPAPAARYNSCSIDADCDPGNLCAKENIYDGDGTCVPEGCEDAIAASGIQLFRALAHEIFISVIPVVNAQGAPRSQPCYRALLGRLAQGDLVCSPEQAATCASQGGKGCFIRPEDSSKYECFTYSNTENKCVGPNAISCSDGKICSACFGGCVNLADFCDDTACKASGGTCSPITLSCVPNVGGQASTCDQICGQAGLSCINGQCAQDRCRGTSCGSSTCDPATGRCVDPAVDPQVVNACEAYGISCPTGYQCASRDRGGSSNDDSPVCLRTVEDQGSATAPTNCPAGTLPGQVNGKYYCQPDICDPTIPTNRHCPPSTICQNVGGFAECKSPANQVCDSIGVGDAANNDCVNGAVCQTVGGVGQCVPAVNANNGKCTSNAQCPVGTACDAATGACKVNRNECATTADCKAGGMGLKTCQNNRCAFPPTMDACYLTEMLNDSDQYGLSAGEVIEAAVYLQGKTCATRTGNTNPNTPVTTLGVPFGTNVNGQYRAPNLTGTGATYLLSGTINMNSYQRYQGGVANSNANRNGNANGKANRNGNANANRNGNTNGSAGGGVAVLCNGGGGCSEPGKVMMKRGNEACTCQTPLLGDFSDADPSVNVTLRRCPTGQGTGLNVGDESAALARAALGLPCYASVYEKDRYGALRAVTTALFCGNTTTDVTGCYRRSAPNDNSYAQAEAVSGCTPKANPDKCDVDESKLPKDGGECPAAPNMPVGQAVGGGGASSAYTAMQEKWTAALVANMHCSFKVNERCPGGGGTVFVNLGEPGYNNFQETWKGDDGKLYTYGRGQLTPLGAFCGGSDVTPASSSPRPSTSPTSVPSSNLALCPDVQTASGAQVQCKYPIHPAYNVSTTSYPNVTSDRLFAVFGGPNTFVPATCWRVEEYDQSSNNAWGANLLAATENENEGFWSRIWNWIKNLFGFGEDEEEVSFSGSDITASLIEDCMIGTHIRTGAEDPLAPGGGVKNRGECKALFPTYYNADGTNRTQAEVCITIYGNKDCIDGRFATPIPATTTSQGTVLQPQATPLPPYVPAIIPNRRYYAVPTCSGSGPSPISPTASPTPVSTRTPSPSPAATPTSGPTSTPSPSPSTGPATICGNTTSCPAGQCKTISGGYGPFCVAQSMCDLGPAPCASGRHMCVTNEGQWSCTTDGLRPAGATCVTCGSVPTPSPTPTVSATPTATPAPLPAALRVTGADSVAANAPYSATICAVDSAGRVLSNYRGRIGFLVTEDPDPVVPFPVNGYPFTAEDQGCHTFTDAFRFGRAGQPFLVVVDIFATPELGGNKKITVTLPSTGGLDGPCPTDLKLCPGGSRVGRTKPQCEFAACPAPVTNSNANGTNACAEDVRVCSEGSVVGRVQPSCSFAPCPRTLGDTNNDGRVTIADLAQVLDSLTGQAAGLTDNQRLRADVNCDGRINLADVAKIANFIVTGGDSPTRVLSCTSNT